MPSSQAPLTLDYFRTQFKALPASATEQDAAKLYKKLSLQAHPDKEGGSTVSQQNLQEVYLEVQKKITINRLLANGSRFATFKLALMLETEATSARQQRYIQPFKLFSYILTAPFTTPVKIISFIFGLISLFFMGLRKACMLLINKLTSGAYEKRRMQWEEDPFSSYSKYLEAFGRQVSVTVFFALMHQLNKGQIHFTEEEIVETCFEGSGQDFYRKYEASLPISEQVVMKLQKHHSDLSVFGGLTHIGLIAASFWDAFNEARFSKPLIALAALICLPVFTVIHLTFTWIVSPILVAIETVLEAAHLAVYELATLPVLMLDTYRAWRDRKAAENMEPTSKMQASPLTQLGMGKPQPPVQRPANTTDYRAPRSAYAPEPANPGSPAQDTNQPLPGFF